jgi:ABC-type amino acid transport substrate-binding protein
VFCWSRAGKIPNSLSCLGYKNGETGHYKICADVFLDTNHFKVRQNGQIVNKMHIPVSQSRLSGKYGENVQLEGAPVIVDGRAMVPVRVLADGLQVPVSWDSATRVVSLGKSALVVGSSLDFPPFEYKAGNDVVGFDIDLIKAIEEMWKEDIVIQDISFDQLIPSLRSGQVDLIVSGLTITEQRKQFVDFTIPYFEWARYY